MKFLPLIFALLLLVAFQSPTRRAANTWVSVAPGVWEISYTDLETGQDFFTPLIQGPASGQHFKVEVLPDASTSSTVRWENIGDAIQVPPGIVGYELSAFIELEVFFPFIEEDNILPDRTRVIFGKSTGLPLDAWTIPAFDGSADFAGASGDTEIPDFVHSFAGWHAPPTMLSSDLDTSLCSVTVQLEDWYFEPNYPMETVVREHETLASFTIRLTLVQ